MTRPLPRESERVVWTTQEFGKRWLEVAAHGATVRLRSEEDGHEVTVLRRELEAIASPLR